MQSFPSADRLGPVTHTTLVHLILYANNSNYRLSSIEKFADAKMRDLDRQEDTFSTGSIKLSTSSSAVQTVSTSSSREKYSNILTH